MSSKKSFLEDVGKQNVYCHVDDSKYIIYYILVILFGSNSKDYLFVPFDLLREGKQNDDYTVLRFRER